MGTKLTLKQVVWIIIFVAFLSFFFFAGTQALINYAKTGADWFSALLGALGNVAGGIIGGIVAIIVATYQINKTFLNEQMKQLQTTNTMLKLINEELKDNVAIIEATIPLQSNDSNLLKTHLSDDTWRSTMIHLVISDSLLVRLNVCYRKIALIKSLEPGDITDDDLRELKEQITSTIDMIKTEIKEDNNLINDSF
jgi:fructose-1-phosphate kinase PfkB-like protein